MWTRGELTAVVSCRDVQVDEIKDAQGSTTAKEAGV